MSSQRKVHIVAGPTASGKSARAIELARSQNGVIINADATQCYADLQVVSARPSAGELAQADHRLYGIWQGDRMASVADWLAVAVSEIKECWQAGSLPIICGGTGFYLKALMEGLSPIPDTDPAIRDELRTQSTEALYERLKECDPTLAKTIDSQNRQRLTRAVEVFESTGIALSEWQTRPKELPLKKATFELEVIDLPRKTLYERCDSRFDIMLECGAVAEVSSLLEKGYPAYMPVMKAVGVPELTAYIKGEIELETASELAKQNTRRYAKRQLTWLRNQF